MGLNMNHRGFADEDVYDMLKERSDLPHVEPILELERQQKLRSETEKSAATALVAAQLETKHEHDILKGSVERQYRAANRAIPDELRESLEATYARNKADLAEFQRQEGDANNRAFADRQVVAEELIYLHAHLHVLKSAPAPDIDGDVREALRNAVANREDQKAKIREVRAWRQPIDGVIAAAFAELDALSARAGVQVARDGTITWASWLHRIPGTQYDTRQDVYPTAFDARVAWLSSPENLKRAKADAERQIREQWGDGPTATDEEKLALIRECRDAILDAERREVACIRLLRAEGQQIGFRGDTDVRALLQVEGPKPRKPLV